MTIEHLVEIAIGVKTTTYFKLMYPIYTGDEKYYILHTAVFGVN